MLGTREDEDAQAGRPRRRMRALLLILFAVAAGLALPYLAIDDEPDRLDDAARAAAAGRFANLSVGRTHYQVAGSYEAGYRQLGALGKPVLLVWGRHDKVVPFSSSARVRALVQPAAFVAVEDAGHLPQYERPDVVNAALLNFLAG